MSIVIQLLDLYRWIIIISAIISWVPIPRDNPLVVALNALTEPVYAPIRRVLDPMKTGGIDLSPLIVLFGISILQNMLISSVY